MTEPGSRRAWWWFAGLVLLGLGALIAASVLLRFNVLGMLAQANAWVADTFIRRMGYWGVFALMFIESSFIPFPSEIVIPPAGDLARRLPDWSLWVVIVMGTAGSLGGALLNYALARYLGRPVLLRLIGRFGYLVRLTPQGYLGAEALFKRHGAVTTFVGRLIPTIRQLISLPAGLARMNLLVFCLLTSLGAGLWVTLLALLGYWFGANTDRMAEWLHAYSRWGLLAALLLFAGVFGRYWLRQRRQRRQRAHLPPAGPSAAPDSNADSV